MRKKLLAIILSVAMMASCLPMPAMAVGQGGETTSASEETGGSSNQQFGQDADNDNGDGAGQAQKVVQVGNQQYSSIKAALSDKTGPQDITLLGDVTLDKDYTINNIIVPATSTVTINGNGHKIAGTITNRGTLTLNNVTVTSAKDTTITNKDTTSKLTIAADATVKNTDNNGIALDAQDGVVTTNGTIQSEKGTAVKLIQANVTVNKGFVQGKTYGVFSKSTTNNGNLNIIGEEYKDEANTKISGETGIYWENPGTLSTSDTKNGTEWNKFFVEGDDGPAIEVVCGTVTISGGEFSSKSDVALKIEKNKSANSLNVTIQDGEFGTGRGANRSFDITGESGETLAQSVTIQIKGGWFYDLIGVGTQQNFISGGYFKDYINESLLAAGAKTIDNQHSNFLYRLICPHQVVSNGTPNQEPEKIVPDTNVAIPEGADISDADREAVEVAAAGVKTEGLEDKAQEVQISEEQKNKAIEALKTQFNANQNSFSDEAKEKLENTDSVEEAIHVYAVPYLSVAPQSYKGGESDINEAKYGLDIEPKYQVVASTAEDVNQVVFGQAKDNNAVALQDSVSNLPVEKAKVMIPLPTGFAQTGTDLYIKHKKDECSKSGESIQYQYKCPIKEIAGVQYIEFDNQHGFSQFTLTKVPTTVASIERAGVRQYYDNLDSAIIDVDNNGTITLEQNIPEETVTVNREVTFTIKTTNQENKNFKYNADSIIAGYNLKREVNGNTFIFTYCPPEPDVPIDTVIVEAADNGQVSVDNKKAKEGDKVTVTTMPNENFVVDQIMVTKPGGEPVLTATQTVNQHHFIMPNSPVNVKVTFKAEQPPVGSSFEDVPDDAWFAPAVQYVTSKGIMNGMSETEFAPNTKTNRAMIVTTLYRMENEPAVTASNPFVDVAEDQWYTDAVRWASEAGIISGYDASHFGPNDPITREQLSKILYGYAMSKGYEEAAAISNIDRFDDATQINSWAKVSMEWANGLGLIQGTSDTMISPQGKAVRAQVATVLMRFCEEVAK